MKNKFIQIAVSSGDEDSSDHVYALDLNGNVWVRPNGLRKEKWELLPAPNFAEELAEDVDE